MRQPRVGRGPVHGARIVALVVVFALLAGCAPTSERRLVSIRQGDLAAGYLTGDLVYVETRGVRRSALFVHDLWANERERIRVPEGQASSPSWSPDGSTIAFSLTLEDGFSHLWIVDAAAQDVLDDGVAPDGDDLDSDEPGGVPSARGTQVTFGSAVDDYPRWSPDGTQLVFSSIRDGAFDWRLHIVDAEPGSEPQPIASAEGHSVYPDWSPDGRYIVYSNRETGRYNLRLYEIDTGVERSLTTTIDGEDLYPRFSPDGDTVIFSTNRDDDSWQIWEIDLATGEQRRLIGSDSMDEFPTYSPDGQFVAFATGHLAIYRRDADVFPDGQLRWAVTQNLAWGPDWRPAQ